MRKAPLVDVHLVIELEESHTVEGRQQKRQLARITLDESPWMGLMKKKNKKQNKSTIFFFFFCVLGDVETRWAKVLVVFSWDAIFSEYQSSTARRRGRETQCVFEGGRCFVLCW